MTINTQELRDIGRAYEPVSHSLSRAIVEAADAIDLQAAEIARLREAAKMLADWAEHEVGAEPDLTPGLAEARAALSGESNG